jgi:hypothetical protein
MRYLGLVLRRERNRLVLDERFRRGGRARQDRHHGARLASAGATRQPKRTRCHRPGDGQDGLPGSRHRDGTGHEDTVVQRLPPEDDRFEPQDDGSPRRLRGSEGVAPAWRQHRSTSRRARCGSCARCCRDAKRSRQRARAGCYARDPTSRLPSPSSREPRSCPTGQDPSGGPPPRRPVRFPLGPSQSLGCASRVRYPQDCPDDPRAFLRRSPARQHLLVSGRHMVASIFLSEA